jgi:succinate dehydrogenase/fumarate reductase flavoprotein subunit
MPLSLSCSLIFAVALKQRMVEMIAKRRVKGREYQMTQGMQGMSRRNFLTGSLTLGGAAVVGGLLTACAGDPSGKTTNAEEGAIVWNQETDVVVVGTGFGGLSAAYEAAKAGSQVLLVEKAPEEDAGGNSRVCAQAIWAPDDVEAGIAYFKEISGDYYLGDMEESLIKTFIEGTQEHADWLFDEFAIETNKLPGTEYANAKTAVDGVGTMLASTEGLGYEAVWRPIYEAVVESPNVTIMFETPFTDLVFDGDNKLVGITAGQNGNTLTIKARKGVVLAPGGFEYNQQLMADFARYPNESWCWGSPYNTGDGIIACMKHDISLWHMTSTTNACRIGVVADWLDSRFNKSVIDLEISGEYGFIWTDRYGKRFMNETRHYQHGYGRDAIFYNDGSKLEWPRIPLWQVFDEVALPKLGTYVCGWLGVVGEFTNEGALEELTKQGLLLKADTIEDLASLMGIDAAVLAAEVNTFNEKAAGGTADEFERAPDKMRPLTAPFYAIQAYPVMVNTNGGPRRDANANIVRVDKTPIERLYSTGEFGSIWAWYYQGAGNISECMVFGRIAGKSVAAFEPWDLSE